MPDLSELPLDVLGHAASFWDAAALLTMATVSRTFSRVVNHNDGYWRTAALSQFPDEDVSVGAYAHDWKTLVLDRNRRNSDGTAIMDTQIQWQENIERIYTRWTSLSKERATKVRTIIDPYGNGNVEMDEPSLSVYVGVSESEEEPITLHLEVRLLRVEGKGGDIVWRSTHHFTWETNSSWGVHRLVERSRLTPDSGFRHDGDILKLQVTARVATFRLRIVETAAMRKRRIGSRGLLDINTEGHEREVMMGQTFRNFREQEPEMLHSQGGGLFFWVCDYREEEGFLPIFRISREQENLPMQQLFKERTNELGEVLLWADRSQDSGEGTYFIKRGLIFSGERMTAAEVRSEVASGTHFVSEKTMLPPVLDDVDGEVLLLVVAQDMEQTYRDERERAFAQLKALQARYLHGYRHVSMKEIIEVGTLLYHDFRIVHLLERHMSRGLVLEKLLERRHLDYACDRCGRIHFTGTRHRCTVCYDYDLCDDCLSLPVVAYRYRFQRGRVHRVQCTEHQESHPFRKVVLRKW